MTLPLFDSAALPRLVQLLGRCGTSKEHSEAVNVAGGGCVNSFRVTQADKQEFERLRVGVADQDIFAAYQQRRTRHSEE